MFLLVSHRFRQTAKKRLCYRQQKTQITPR